jgi:L-lysine exporter family protein LysE/ArgO
VAIAALAGFATGGSLIVAIGAQNTFVLRQGLRQEHVLPIVALCAAADAALIVAGVAGLGEFIQAAPGALAWLRLAGALFLAVYGWKALRRALVPHHAVVASGSPMTLQAAVVTTLAFTFLNPHVYLDTVVLVGALANQHQGAERWQFAAGAAAASVVWFSALGFGAKLLVPLFARPVTWRVLDASIALVMCSLAASLLLI